MLAGAQNRNIHHAGRALACAPHAEIPADLALEAGAASSSTNQLGEVFAWAQELRSHSRTSLKVLSDLESSIDAK